ncbi:MAG TPA: PqqD family protein [Patescibacteria group bacterium]|nr:PqqD family protein [Patescibacteria group bacterium]
MGRWSRALPEVNLLDLIPKRTIEHEIGDDNLVTLLAPRFKSAFLRKWLEPRLKQPFLKVKLDEVGSTVWLLCDGIRTVKEIAEPLRERFQDSLEPCYDRLGAFLQQLEGARFICYLNYEACLGERNR